MERFVAKHYRRAFSSKQEVLDTCYGSVGLDDSCLIMEGKSASSNATTMLLGGLVAQALRKNRTVQVPFNRITDIKMKGKKKIDVVTLNNRDKKQKYAFSVYREKGLLGGRGNLTGEFYEKLRQRCLN